MRRTGWVPRSINDEAGEQANPILKIACIQDLPNQDQVIDYLSDADTSLRDQYEAGTLARLNELAEMTFHGVLVMTDEHPTLIRGKPENHRIVETFQRHSFGSLEVHSRGAA